MPKISELPLASKLKEEDYIPIVQDGVTKRIKGTHFVTEEEYSLDVFSPVIIANNKAMYKLGEGDTTDFSYSTYDGQVKSAILYGSTKYKDVDTDEILETFEEGRNLELVSVKMPVLTTTGKNLLNMNNITLGSYVSGNGGYGNEISFQKDAKRAYITIPVKPNTKYTYKSTNIYGYLRYMKNLGVEAGFTFGDSLTRTITTTEETNYISINFRPTGETVQQLTREMIDGAEIMFVEGEDTSSYEPFKSNILTTNEEVELRGVGDVKDTLNCVTGEYVQHIKEVVLDGSSDEIIGMGNVNDTTLIRFNISNVEGVQAWNVNKVLCSSLPYLHIHDLSGGSASVRQECISNHSQDANMINIVIKRSRLSSVDVAGFRAYLQSNPITIQYSIATPIVKTVDLSGTLFGYKNGHIIKSSEEGSLLPELEYEVAISRGAQISQNTTTLIRHDEKISELLKKTAAVYINQKVKIANLLDEVGTQDKVQTVPLVDMTDSDMVLDNMGVEHEIEIVENPDSLLINLIYDLIELNDTFELLEKVEVLRRSGLIDKQNYEVIKVKLNGAFEGE